MKKGDYKSIVAKMENIWTKIFLQKIDQESCGWNSFVKFWFHPTAFPVIIIPNIVKSNHILPGKGRGDKDFILTYLDSSMTDVFPQYCLFFSILNILRRKRGVKVGPKVLILRPSFFHKYSNSSKIFKQCFCLLEY